MRTRLDQLTTFVQNIRGTAPERWALIAGAIAVVSVLGTHLLDMAARNGTLPAIVLQRSSTAVARTAQTPATVTSVQQNAAGVDYTVTASIPSLSAGVRLDPCTGTAK